MGGFSAISPFRHRVTRRAVDVNPPVTVRASAAVRTRGRTGRLTSAVWHLWAEQAVPGNRRKPDGKTVSVYSYHAPLALFRACSDEIVFVAFCRVLSPLTPVPSPLGGERGEWYSGPLNSLRIPRVATKRRWHLPSLQDTLQHIEILFSRCRKRL
jgi:hypothetical protein